MALTKQELDILNWGKSNGKNNMEIMKAIRNSRDRSTDFSIKQKAMKETGAPSPLFASMHQGNTVGETTMGQKTPTWISSPGEMIKDAPSLVTETYRGIKEPAEERRDLARRQAEQGTQLPESMEGAFSTLVNAPPAILEGALGGVGGLIMGAGKVVLSKEREDMVKEEFGEAAGKVMAQKDVAKLNSWLEDLKTNDPNSYSKVRTTLSFGEAVVEILGTHGALQYMTQPTKKVKKFTHVDGSEVKPLVTAEEVVGKQGDEILDIAKTKRDIELGGETTRMRLQAEAEAPTLSFSERQIGLREDQLKRIQGNEDLVRDYINVAQARNKGDFVYDEAGNKQSIPSPLGYGASRAEGAAEVMKAKLNDTGSSIGGVRQKLATTRVDQQAVEAMEDSFMGGLSDLNLTVRNGKVVPMSGRNPLTAAKGDITALQDLYDNMLTVKEAPNLQNYYEFRSILDSKVNYAKSAGEASNSLDPFSRGVRTTIRDESNRILGSSYADQLKEYSDFMDAYKDLTSYTNRAAGGEYVMRLLDSGRSRQADDLIRTIADYTGVDLKDDAMMANLVTDMFGNPSQKTQFAQELQKLGIQIATGDKIGLVATLAQKGYRGLINEEKILLKAAAKQPVGVPLSDEAKLAAGGAAAYGLGVYTTDEEGNPFILPGAVAVMGTLNPASRKLMIKELKKSSADMYQRMIKTKDAAAKKNLKLKHQELEKQIRELESSFSLSATTKTTKGGEVLPTTKMFESPNLLKAMTSSYWELSDKQKSLLQKQLSKTDEELKQYLFEIQTKNPGVAAATEVAKYNDFQFSSKDQFDEWVKEAEENFIQNGYKSGELDDVVDPTAKQAFIDHYSFVREENRIPSISAESYKPTTLEVARNYNEGFANTDSLRGGTWYASKDSKNWDFSEEAKNTIGVGGKERVETTVSTIKPLVIEEASLGRGARSVLDEELPEEIRSLIPEKDQSIIEKISDLETEFDSIYGDKTEAQIKADIKKAALTSPSIKELGLSNTDLTNIMKNPHPGEAITDTIISHNLKKAGHDSLVLKAGPETHVFKFADSNQSISEKFLSQWVERAFDEPSIKLSDDEIKQMIEETKDFPKPPGKITLYRGTSPGDAGNSNAITSWTSREEIAQDFAEAKDGMVITQDFDPDDILVSLTDLPEDLKKKYKVIDEEEEFLIKPLKFRE